LAYKIQTPGNYPEENIQQAIVGYVPKIHDCKPTDIYPYKRLKAQW
jgi:hypothetical protein